MTGPSTAAAAPDRPHRADRPDRLLGLGMLLLGLGTRLPFLRADEGWFDEIFSLYAAGQPFGDILATARSDQTNPPGFYLLLHLWGGFGPQDLPWQRLLVALCGAALPALVVLTARRLGVSRWSAGLAGLIAITAPMLWQMSLEVRAYAVLGLLSAVALWQAAGLVTQASAAPRRVAALALTHVAMVMLHYFAAFSVLGISLAVASWPQPAATLRARLGRLLLLGVPAAAALGAWLLFVAAPGGGIGGRNVAWIPETTLLEALAQLPGLLIADLGGLSALFPALLLGGGLLLALTQLAGRSGDSSMAQARARFVLLAAALPVLLALALHLFGGRNIWVARYLTGFLPALALLPALVVDRVPTTLRRATTVAVALWCLVAGAFAFAARWPKPDWTRILAILAPDGRATICAENTFVGLPLLYYARTQQLEGLRVVQPGLCTTGNGPTWLVYRAEVEPPAMPGLALGPRIALSRGLQSLDLRRVYQMPRTN